MISIEGVILLVLKNVSEKGFYNASMFIIISYKCQCASVWPKFTTQNKSTVSISLRYFSFYCGIVTRISYYIMTFQCVDKCMTCGMKNYLFISMLTFVNI